VTIKRFKLFAICRTILHRVSSSVQPPQGGEKKLEMYVCEVAATSA